MEILHNLWNVLCTEDENLIRYISILMSFLETYATLKLFTSALDINYTKNQRNLYFLLLFICTILTTFIITYYLYYTK